jgi:cytidyltransferase-like protein
MIKIIVAGTFDGLHIGHRELLDVVSFLTPSFKVIVNSDEMILKRKPNLKLVNNEQQRVKLIQDAYSLSEVVIKNNLNEIKEEIKNSILFHGDDYNIKSLSKLYGVDKEWWKQNSVKLCFVPRTTNMSSTKLREIKQIIVVGMYCSGCSLVSGILQNLGVDMGDIRDDFHTSDGVKIPNYECRLSIDVSEKLRDQVGQRTLWEVNTETWKKVKDTSIIKEYIDIRNTKQIWGVKDQKMLPFLKLMFPYLNNPYIIITDRGKEKTVEGMKTLKMTENSTKTVEEIYDEYEKIINEIKLLPHLLIDTSGKSDDISRVKKIADYVGLPVTDGALEFFKQYVKNN